MQSRIKTLSSFIKMFCCYKRTIFIVNLTNICILSLFKSYKKTNNKKTYCICHLNLKSRIKYHRNLSVLKNSIDLSCLNVHPRESQDSVRIPLPILHTCTRAIPGRNLELIFSSFHLRSYLKKFYCLIFCFQIILSFYGGLTLPLLRSLYLATMYYHSD